MARQSHLWCRVVSLAVLVLLMVLLAFFVGSLSSRTEPRPVAPTSSAPVIGGLTATIDEEDRDAGSKRPTRQKDIQPIEEVRDASSKRQTAAARQDIQERATTAVVVLGQALHSDLMPRAGLRNRVRAAAALWARLDCQACIIVLSGGPGKFEPGERETISEASAMLELLQCAAKKPIPRHAILLEEASTNTAENARNSVQLLSPFAGIHTLYVVTSEWHAARARVPFEVFAPTGWRLNMESAPASRGDSGHSTDSDLRLLPSTLGDIERIAPAVPASNAFLLWHYASRSLAGKRPIHITASPVVVFTASAAPPAATEARLPGLTLLGPCLDVLVLGDGSRVLPAVVVALDAGPRSKALCSLGSVFFLALTKVRLEELSRASNMDVSGLAPLAGDLWAVRIDCNSDQFPTERLSNDVSKLAQQLRCRPP
jgi:uncharacterized SAM-binding protein YcdF (DUF218 family)